MHMYFRMNNGGDIYDGPVEYKAAAAATMASAAGGGTAAGCILHPSIDMNED